MAYITGFSLQSVEAVQGGGREAVGARLRGAEGAWFGAVLGLGEQDQEQRREKEQRQEQVQ